MRSTHLVLGLARPRTDWLVAVGRWASSSTIPIDFVRCVSAEEVRSRLESDRHHTAVLLDERMLGLDRELLGAAHAAGCAAIVIGDTAPRRDWCSLGASAVLTEPLEPHTLLAAIDEHGHRELSRLGDPVHGSPLPSGPASADHESAPGRLVAVTGSGGTGTSITAMAIAADLARSARHGGPIALIDACRDGDQALLHDLGDVVPGLPELIESHRTAIPDRATVQSHLWFCPHHGYDVLPGLRRHRDWSSLRRRSTTAALASLRRAYPLVIADIDPDVEGEAETGSIDIEERNHLSRSLLSDADVIVLTARPSITGIARLVRRVTELVAFGIELDRLCPVVIGAPRAKRERSALSRSIRELLADLRPDLSLPVPVMVPTRRDLDLALLDPSTTDISMGVVSQTIDSMLRILPARAPSPDGPIAIIPGHLGLTA